VIDLQRAGVGNSRSVCTASDLPFANDVTETIAGFLSAKDYCVIPIFVKEQARVMKLMSANKADRNLLIIVKKWKSYTYMNLGLGYEIELNIFDKNLNKLTSFSVVGNKFLSGSFWDPPSAARREKPLAFLQFL